MGLLHRREGEQQHARRFQMRERMLAIGDDYWIEDEQGQRAFLVDGKAMRIRDTWILKDPGGNEVAKIQEKKLTVRDKIVIELASGTKATVKKALVGVRERFHIDVDGGDDLKAHGNIVDHEYEIEGDHKLAEVSKKWFRIRETYGVEVEPGVDPVLMLAITVAIDGMSRDV